MFSIYVTPYTPAFGNWAFAYEPKKDRFADVPSAGVDILMTHGPAYGRLDRTSRDEFAGCKTVAETVRRTKPKVHCFGHIHEGYGAQLVTWTKPDERLEQAHRNEHQDDIRWIDAKDLTPSEQTLSINAAMLDDKNECGNAPWVVDLQLQQGDPPADDDDDEDDDEEEEEEEEESDEDSDEESEDESEDESENEQTDNGVDALSTKTKELSL